MKHQQPREISTEDEKLDLTESQDKERNIEDAEEFISKGKYLEAMNIYQGILSSNPEDKKALQRIEELKTLFKLMGKDKEALISKLNLFLESINKKRDEFYRGSERDS
jgi:tryptophanyl-tRNA synthetase